MKKLIVGVVLFALLAVTLFAAGCGSGTKVPAGAIAAIGDRRGHAGAVRRDLEAG